MGENNTFGFFNDEEPAQTRQNSHHPNTVTNSEEPTQTQQNLHHPDPSDSYEKTISQKPPGDAPLPTSSNTDQQKPLVQRYLVFQLGGNKYATPLLAAREVIEVPAFRAIPNTRDYFLGIANLRGEVVGLIDLRKMFGFEDRIHDRSSVILYESDSGPLGAMIDEISGVINLKQSDITTEINIKTSVPQKYLMGIGKLPDDELVILLELRSILEEDELLSVQAIKESA